MKRCAQCGRIYNDDSLSFCLYDGKPLEAVGPPAQSAPPPAPSGPEQAPPSQGGHVTPGVYAPRSSKPFPIGWVIFGIVAVLIVGRIGLGMLGSLHSGGLGGGDQAAVVGVIQKADAAEAQADKTLDAGALSQYYTGNALENVQSEVENLKGQGVYEDGHLENSQVQAVAFDGASQNAAVQVVETWSATFYNTQSNQIVRTVPSQAMPQTIHLQRSGDGWLITQIDFNGVAAPVGNPSGQ